MSNETFFGILKDGVLVLFVTFFGLVAIAINSFGLDGEGSGSSAAQGGSGSGIIDVTLDEFVINGDLTAPAGDVRLQIVNVGTVTHNVVARGLGRRTPDIRLGGEAELGLGTLAPGSYELFCDITGHEESGMVATLAVTDTQPGSG